jgi:hypothetical protein
VTGRAYYPDFISLRADHGVAATPALLASEYARLFRDAGFGPMTGYSVAGMDDRVARGTQRDLESAIARLGVEEAHIFKLVFKDQTSVVCSRSERRRAWEVEAQYPMDAPPKVEWMKKIAKAGTGSVGIPEFDFAALRRKQGSWVEFVPEPPLARAHHLVTVTEKEVADSYDDPESFWSVWDSIERVGEQRVCARALDELDDRDWLARTFEQTMRLARLAKPGLTYYNEPRWTDAFRPWWEYGDVQHEKAGYPALSPAGYDAGTKTFEFTGFCTKASLEKGGPEPRHVLIREIHEVRALVAAQRDANGRRVETVRIVFPEEWMARQERRPLLDVGAVVFYMDRKSGRLVEVAD